MSKRTREQRQNPKLAKHSPTKNKNRIVTIVTESELTAKAQSVKHIAKKYRKKRLNSIDLPEALEEATPLYEEPYNSYPDNESINEDTSSSDDEAINEIEEEILLPSSEDENINELDAPLLDEEEEVEDIQASADSSQDTVAHEEEIPIVEETVAPNEEAKVDANQEESALAIDNVNQAASDEEPSFFEEADELKELDAIDDEIDDLIAEDGGESVMVHENIDENVNAPEEAEIIVVPEIDIYEEGELPYWKRECYREEAKVRDEAAPSSNDDSTTFIPASLTTPVSEQMVSEPIEAEEGPAEEASQSIVESAEVKEEEGCEEPAKEEAEGSEATSTDSEEEEVEEGKSGSKLINAIIVLFVLLIGLVIADLILMKSHPDLAKSIYIKIADAFSAVVARFKK